MDDDRLLQDKAFSFVRVAPRPRKPREIGLTIVADRGMGLHRATDLMESAGDYVDLVKIAIGAFRLQSEAFLRRKIEIFRNAGAGTFFAGDVTEAAFMQGVSEKFYRTVKDLGADAVEVSSAQVAMALDDKCELIRMACACGLKVVAEAGQKGKEEWTQSRNYVAAQVRAYQKAGAWKVLVQGEGVTEGVDRMNEALVLDLVAQFDVQDFIFQAKDSQSQQWYIDRLGNNVNLDVDDHQVIDVELMRRGIRKRGVFGLVGGL